VSAINLEIFYRFTPEWRAWAPYVGAGPAFLLVDFDPELGEGDTSTDAGFNLVFGIERGFTRRKLFVESKIGLADAPDFKTSFGLTFLRVRSSTD
jgi:hypothetical protein